MLSTDRLIDRRILQEADALEADGWHVTILAVPTASCDDDPRVIRVAGQLANAAAPRKELALFRTYGFLRQFLSPNGLFLAPLRSLALHFLVRPDVFARNLILPAALEHPSDVVVAHDLPVLAAAVSIAKHHAAKLVYDSHELYSEQEFGPRLRRLWQRIEEDQIGHCDAVITVNPSIAHELERRYHLDHVHVVHNAARVDGPVPAKGRRFHVAFDLEPTATILLFQGGLMAGRHLETLVDAIAFIAPSLHLVLLGDGPLANTLQRRARSRGIGHRVHFHPAVPQRDLLEYTASADLGIIPYQANCLNNLYCTPNKLFEYVAAGVPIVATDLPELRRLIAGNGIGRVADTTSPRDIARAAGALLADEEALSSLRQRVIDVREQLNWNREAKTLVEIFRGLRC